ncbi:MAG: O-antigen ligase family protein [Acidimicrobiia bacterium]
MTPLVVFVVVGASPVVGLTRVVAAALGLAMIAVLSRHPGPTLVGLVWFLPLQIPLFSFLYHHGVPGPAVRPFGALKEVFALAILVAAVRAIRAEHRRLDALDKLVLGFVAALVLYLVAPMIVSTADLYPRSLSTRLLGFRVNAGFVLVFFAARHAPIDARWRRRFVSSIVAVAALFAAFGLYQYARPESFTDFVFNTLGIPYYHLDVLDSPVESVMQLVRWTTARPVRVGSLFVGPFSFADFMLIPAGLLLARLARRGARGREIALLVAFGAAIFASQTRANLVGLGVMALLAMTPRRRDSFTNQLRVIAMVALAVVAFIPNLASTRVGGVGAAESSTNAHVDEIRGGIELLQDYPLGLGLGTAPAVAVREEGAPVIISDNSLLQVGNELGAVMMVFFIVIVVVLLRRLAKTARGDPPNDLAAGAMLAILGLVVSGQFHHVFQNFAISWLVWGVAGLGLAASARLASTTDEQRETSGDGPPLDTVTPG